MKFNILIGGKAGQGPNFLAGLLGEALIDFGYYVFYSRDYQSLIRGGHNFNLITLSEKPVYSNESKIDLLVGFDTETLEIHKKELKKGAKIIDGEGSNTFFAGRLFKILGIEFEILDSKLKNLRNYEQNIAEAKKGYETEKSDIGLKKLKKQNILMKSGTEGASDGALKSGLEIYYAYPMTPATPLLTELASKQNENMKAIELENEISVANAAIGSIIMGKKTMVGSSGGGFDLMTETLSLAGQIEAPLIIYLASRPGPSTGVATYTSQGDLGLALKAGHGEFFRIVVCPGNPKDSAELMSQAFYLANKYKVPCIFLTDKHLGESLYSTDGKIKIINSKNTMELKKYNSYEHTEEGVSTEDAKIIKENFDKRAKKVQKLEDESEKFEKIKIFGNKKSKNVIISYGSTQGAIVDAINQIDCKFIQVLYMSPFPKTLKKELEKAKKIVLVENSSTGTLANLVKVYTGIEIKNKILKYDGRPFFSDELNVELKKYFK
jgi:2-oxoglutarate/2-oxoacid ferredoxin oxidoreductase subunit alpha